MKTGLNRLRKAILGMTLATVMAGFGVAPVLAQAQPVKGGERMLTEIKQPTQAEALKPGDTMAMVCEKCKSVTVQTITTEKGHTFMKPGEKHACPGCASTIEVLGIGKGAKEQVKHVCSKCGDKSVFCCATKPGESPTEGMQH